MLYEQEKIAIEYFKECIKKGSIFEEDLTLNFMQTSLYFVERLQKENEEKDKEIEYWKEQAEGYKGLSQQIKEEYEQRLEDYYNEG